MRGLEETRNLLQHILAYSTADQTEVIFLGRESGLTRFANNAIHQNVAEAETAIRVRAILGHKIGVAATNDLSNDSLKATARRALVNARLQNEDPYFRSLPGPSPCISVNAFMERTAACSPEQRARVVEVVCRKALEAGLVAAGTFSTNNQEVAVANSLGVFAYQPLTSAEVTAVMMSDTSSGYADFCSVDVAQIDAEAIATEAIGKALRSRNPISLEPGDYEVVLEEPAVADILSFVAAQTFSGLASQEGRSLMKLGRRLMDEKISIWDDGLSPTGLPMPFDCEGVPKQRIKLVEKGIAQAVVYDSYTGSKVGKQSTGHALPVPSAIWPLPPHVDAGPQPAHLFLKAGTTSIEQMVSGIKRGLWVTRFNYTRLAHPLRVIVTGTTRDGTFLIENGEISYPVKNLRYAQGYVEALTNVVSVGQRTKTQKTPFGASRVPALHLGSFRFTGATEF